jgi:hypothetical protein
MKLIDQVVEAFDQKSVAMHVDEIAEAIIKRYPNIALAKDVLTQKVNGLLATEVKKKRGESLFSKPKNKQGKGRKGYYRLKIGRKAMPKTFKVPEQPKVSGLFTGKAGEYAVMSELLFFGFNVSMMTVDDGIDLVASKDNSYFHIQVKTSNINSRSKYQFTLTKKAFGSKDASGTFYVLVMRVGEDSRNTCDFLVFPSSEIRRLVDIAVIRDGDSMSITVEKERGKRFLLNGIQDVSMALNRFDIIR